MKNFNILIKLTIITYIVSVLPTILFAFITCPKEFLYQIGLNATCETDDGKNISCDGSSPFHIKRATIVCTEDYFNHLPEQKMFCDTDVGKWFPQPLRCFRHCDKEGSPEKIEFNTNKTEYPWYAEILKNPTSNGAEETIPALIMTGRMVMTWEKYFDKDVDWKFNNYVARIYNPPDKFEDFKIDHIEYVHSEPVYNISRRTKYDPFSVLVLKNDNYIKINNGDTRPPCLDHEIFQDNNWFVEVIRAIPEYNLRPEYPDKCLVPKIENDKNIEIMCYDHIKSKPLEKCSEDKVPILQTKCKFGYEKMNSTNLDDTLSICIANRWYLNNEEEYNNGCEMICGEIDENETDENEIKRSPWNVAIYLNKTRSILSPYDQICSGVIIHKNIILSAAHCFYDKEEEKLEDSSSYLVAAGKSFHNYKKIEDSEQFTKISEIHIPLTYGKGNWNNDIAIVILNSSFTYNSYVKPICIDLNSNNDLKNGTEGYIFGWRATSKDDIINNKLQLFNITALTRDQCFTENNEITKATNGSFCSITNKPPIICKGDSGGGFFLKENFNSKDRFVLKGIISSDVKRKQYCSNNPFIIFTDLEYVKEFLREKIYERREKLNDDDISKVIWHRIYAHGVWAAPYSIRKELNLTLSEKVRESGYF